MQLSIAQVDRQVLDRFLSCVGYGKVYGPYKPVCRSKAQQPYFVFLSSSFEKTQAIVALLWTWLNPVKRDQARKMLVTGKQYATRPKLKTGPKKKDIGETIRG